MENSLLSEFGGSKGARESSRDVGRSDLEFSWILQMITSLFIVYIVYSLLEHYRYINMGWKEAWIKICDGLVLCDN